MTKILRESLLTEDHWKDSKDESQMVKIQLKAIQEDVEQLLQKIEDGDQFDAWIQAKIAVAEHSMSAVRDYIILGDEDEKEIAPEVITDNPPMDVAPEAPVPVVEPGDELEMDDLVGPGPEVAGEAGDVEDEMPAEEMEEPLEEYGEDEHPAQEWGEQEADRRWQRDNDRMYDPDEEFEYPEDYMEEDYMMESLENFMVEKQFSGKKREKLAKTGAAMKNGSYPIESKQDLKNAIKAYGRAKNKAATKKHIISRAKSLGATGLLPEDWKVNEGMDDFNKPDERISVELDTALSVVEHSDRDWVIDRYGDDDEEFFLNFLKKHGIEYEVIDPEGPGGGWPIIEYTGTKEQLIPFFALMSPSGYSEDEIEEMLADWNGDQDDPDFQEVMY